MNERIFPQPAKLVAAEALGDSDHAGFGIALG